MEIYSGQGIGEKQAKMIAAEGQNLVKLFSFGWQDAISRLAVEAQVNRGVDAYTHEKELNQRFSDKIKSMSFVELGMQKYETMVKELYMLKDALFELSGNIVQGNKSSAILNKAISEKDNNIRALSEKIMENLQKTTGLPTTKGFITKPNQTVAFQLRKGTIAIDIKETIRVCKRLFEQVKMNSAEKSKYNQNDRNLSDFARQTGITMEEAKKIKEEKEIESFNQDARNTKTIKQVLQMQIPPEVSSKFTHQQISSFYKQRAQDLQNLKKFSDRSNDIAKLKRDINKHQDLLDRIVRGELPLDEKDKNKIIKTLQRSIKKQEKMNAKLTKQNFKLKTKLSKFFDNLDSYKTFVTTSKKINIPQFDNKQQLEAAINQGQIKRDEPYFIGQVSQEEIDYVKKFWQAEIQSANVRNGKNQTFQLSEATGMEKKDNSFKSSLRNEISPEAQKEAIKNTMEQDKQTEQGREQD